MESLVKGSIEYLVVDVDDELGNLTTLTGTNPTFTTRTSDDAETVIQSNTAAGVSGLRALCLIDTTLAGYAVAKRYKLTLKFTNLPEVPILGPYEFKIDD